MNQESKGQEAEAVTWFANKMAEKLWEKAHKSGWSDMADSELLERIENERCELIRAVDDRSDHAIIREAADLANFAMFLANNHRPRNRRPRDQG